MGLLRSGFALRAVEEAQSPKEMIDLSGMADELCRPMMLLIKAEKSARLCQAGNQSALMTLIWHMRIVARAASCVAGVTPAQQEASSVMGISG